MMSHSSAVASSEISDIILSNDSERIDENILMQVYTDEEEELEKLEMMETGSIKSYVYLSYFKAAGYSMSTLVLLSTFLMQGSSTVMALWWSEWAQNNDKYSTNQFLYITCSIAGVNILCALIRSILFAYAGLYAAESLYNQLIQSLFHTSLYFFETTSLGKIINRFGKVSDSKMILYLLLVTYICIHVIF